MFLSATTTLGKYKYETHESTQFVIFGRNNSKAPLLLRVLSLKDILTFFRKPIQNRNQCFCDRSPSNLMCYGPSKKQFIGKLH